jgi:hypothetical protein
LPAVSATVTASGVSPWTLDETRLTIACTCVELRDLPLRVRTSTDALAFVSSSTNASRFGSTRCTVAVCTTSSDPTVRESSPSIARW